MPHRCTCIEDADETYYVLEGEYTFFVGDESIRASVGRTIFAPRRIPHTYRAESAARHLWVISPAGLKRSLLKWDHRRATAELRRPTKNPIWSDSARSRRATGSG